MVNLPPYNSSSSEQWYTRVGSVVDGPMPADLVFQLSDTTMDHQTRYICKAGFEQWYPLKDMRRAMSDRIPAASLHRRNAGNSPSSNPVRERQISELNQILANIRAENRRAAPGAALRGTRLQTQKNQESRDSQQLINTGIARKSPSPSHPGGSGEARRRQNLGVYSPAASEPSTHNPFYDPPAQAAASFRVPWHQEPECDEQSYEFIQELIQSTPYKPTIGDHILAPVRFLTADLAIRRALVAFIVCGGAAGTYWATQPKQTLDARIAKPRVETTIFQKIANIAELLNLRDKTVRPKPSDLLLANSKPEGKKRKKQETKSRSPSRQMAISLPQPLTQYWQVTPHKDGKGFAVKLADELFVDETAKPKAVLRDELRAVIAALRTMVDSHEIYVSGELENSDPHFVPGKREKSLARKRADFVARQLKVLHPNPQKIHMGGAISAKTPGRSSVTLTLRQQALVISKRQPTDATKKRL